MSLSPPLGLLCLALFAGCATAPPSGAAEVHGPHGVSGFRSAHALFYVVPVDESGVVLVDAGFDRSGEDVQRAVAGRTIRAVLITHSHVDHWSGAHVAGDAPVYAGGADVAAMRGLRPHRDFLNRLADVHWPRPPLPADLRAVEDGQTIVVGAETFHARLVPGHTPGSVVWLWRDLAFSGDALLVDGSPLARVVVADIRQAKRSLSRLWGERIAVVLDGHDGRHDDAVHYLEGLMRDPEGER